MPFVDQGGRRVGGGMVGEGGGGGGREAGRIEKQLVPAPNKVLQKYIPVGAG